MLRCKLGNMKACKLAVCIVSVDSVALVNFIDEWRHLTDLPIVVDAFSHKTRAEWSDGFAAGD